MMFNRLKQKSKNQATEQSSKNIALLLLAATLVCVSFSLFSSVLTWVLLLVACGAVIRGAIYLNHYKHLPSIRTLNLLAVLSILGLIYSALSAGLLFGMVNLLILACALKLMQMRSQKDVYQLVISLFFLIGCGFIFNQSIGFSLFYALMSLALLLSLACYHAPSIAIQKQLKTISILSLQAIPIGLLMFLVLPQLSPLWHVPKAKGTQTGLSKQMTPGDIANLSQSSELAFRATFEDTPPIPRQRYWRAIVMEDFDGKTWKVHAYRQKVREYQLETRQQFKPKLTGSFFNYEVIAEPTYQPWLFALDIAVPAAQSSRNIMQSSDFLLSNRQPVVSKYQYAVRSYPEALASQTLTAADKQLNLRLPENGNNRTQTWVTGLRTQFKDNNHFVKAVLRHFVENPFIYTLRPEVMLVDPVDRFLFDNQAGFCSHYASALAYVLRLGGIPARIVAGYQGGELVENSGESSYLSIYQYDAHAWVETWSDTTGWQRIDPTALVSPDRIEFGLRQAMQEEGSFLAGSPFALARLTNIALLNNIRLFLADIDYNWSRWVLGFNSEKQRDLFKSILGKLTPERLSILGVSIVLTIALLMSLFFLPHWLQNRVSTTQRLYLKALNAFEKAGTQRSNWQGPSAFSQQISEHYSNKISQPFDQITQLYLRLTYQNKQDTAASVLSAKQCHRMMRRHLALIKIELLKNNA
ncbi:MAG: transglutaminase-like putative cysteine protease [Paraglaciecola sp.]|jgi:transglutaminase-like putative cysteine protease